MARFSLNRFSALAVGLGVLALAGCTRSKPKVIFMPDMVDSPAYKAQEEGVMRPPVEGTVPRGFAPFAYRDDAEAAGRELKNPLRPTASVLKRGQFMYQTNCLPCHGPAGEGDGTVVPKFPRPPTLQSEKIKKWPDGMFYHIMTVGRNLMPSYAAQVQPGDRWAIVHYIHALQRSKNPSREDVQQYEQESK